MVLAILQYYCSSVDSTGALFQFWQKKKRKGYKADCFPKELRSVKLPWKLPGINSKIDFKRDQERNFRKTQAYKISAGMGSRQFCRGRGQKADRSRQRRGRELEARQREIDVVCVVLIIVDLFFWTLTCSCFVVNDIYQWKTLQRSFIKKYIKYQTEAETMRQSRGSKVETEARPCDGVRPRRGRAS